MDTSHACVQQAWRTHQLAKHGLYTLETISQYDDFLSSIRHVADVGCGTGDDIHWWATLENNDDPPKPYNFNCFAVDNNQDKLAQVPTLKNIHKIHDTYDRPALFPVSIDFMWAHDSLQYSTNPLETLRMWNSYMTVNGMLSLTVQQSNGVQDHRYYSRTYNNCFFNYTPTNLIYMLAVNGFDCSDAYLLKKFNDPWIQITVYKSDIEPMDPRTTTWYDLVDKNLLHPSIVNSINRNGFLKQEEIIMPWLDKENYYIDWIPQQTVIPEEAGDPLINGVFNKTVPAKTSKLAQANSKVVSETLLKPIGIMRTPKQRFVK